MPDPTTVDLYKIDEVDFRRSNAFHPSPNLTPLGNAVDFLNLKLSESLKDGISILEVGCGFQSLLKEQVEGRCSWYGIDVLAGTTEHPSLATKIASVNCIPYPNEYFDLVISNQSIEHWFEYNVKFSDGLSEINRVLKPTGKAILNFPIHLHGHKVFVTGDLKHLNKCIENSGFKIAKKVAVFDSEHSNYKGWRKCGFPDWYVTKKRRLVERSQVVEYELKKTSSTYSRRTNESIEPRKSKFSRAFHHGYLYFIWKCLNYFWQSHRL